MSSEKEECEHIYGLIDPILDSRTYIISYDMHDFKFWQDYIEFDYCPLCGQPLEQLT